MSDKIRSYAELREFIRVSLRAQHPEWIRPDGDSPICDFYEARFAELLRLTRSQEDAKTSIQPHRRGETCSTLLGGSSESVVSASPGERFNV